MKNYAAALILFMFATAVLAQDPVAIEWQRTEGDSLYHFLECITETMDGGFVVVTIANISGYGMIDCRLIKYDEDGLEQWQSDLISPGGIYNPQNVIQTMDGGYVIVGSYMPPDMGITYDCWLAKTNGSGELQWEIFLGGTHVDRANDVLEMQGGDLLMAGHTNSSDGDVIGNTGSLDMDIWIVRLSATGDILWQKLLSGELDDYANDLLATNDGGYILTGSTSSHTGDVSGNHGSWDMWVVKLSPTTEIEWQRCLGGAGLDSGNAVLESIDGFFCVGSTSSNDGDVSGNHGGKDLWVVKLDPQGSIEWQNCLGGTADEAFGDIVKQDDGGFAIVSKSSSVDGDVNGSHGSDEIWYVELGPSGQLEWQRCIGGSSWEANPRMVRHDTGYIIAANTSSEDGDVAGNIWFPTLWLVKLTTQFNKILGKLYVDLNEDLIHQSSEPVLSHRLVTASTGQICISQPSGNFELVVTEAGSYSVTVAELDYYATVPSVHSVEFLGLYEEANTRDFAFQPNVIANDLQVEMMPMGGFRPGFLLNYQLSYRNIGTTTLSPTLVFRKDPSLSYISSSNTPYLITEDSLIWILPEMTPYQQGTIAVQFVMDTAAILGTEVFSSAEIRPVPNDDDPSNNLSQRWDTITGSFDPNDIQVDRSSILLPETATSDPLGYTIRFQNTGTDTAFTVLIKNPLPENADHASLTFVDASHEVELDYSNETNTMWFRFNNILLPDSNTNESRSHGFVRYRIQPLTDLMLGDSILNQASIFFDFNAPVITNTAYTVIENTTGISDHSTATFQMFPNPTTGQLNIRLASHATGSITIHDALGRQLVQSPINGNHHQLDLSDRPKGFYLITLQTDQGISTQRLVLE